MPIENDTVIHTSTREEYLALMEILDKHGYVWKSGLCPDQEDNFSKNGSLTCVRLHEYMDINKAMAFCHRRFYENQGCTILTLDDLKNILEPNLNMKLISAIRRVV